MTEPTPIGVAVALVFRQRWGVAVAPSFANRVGGAVLTGPPSKVACKARSVDGGGDVTVLTSVGELRAILAQPLG